VGQERHRSRFSRQKIIVIPNGIDLDRFQRDVSGQESRPRQWGVPGDEHRRSGWSHRSQKDYPGFISAAALSPAQN